MKKKVSVIIPAYNAARYLTETLESVHNQTVTVDEIILMDDGSTDFTKDLISDFRDVKYFWQPNSGTAIALNEAIKKASGDYFAFLDADDLWIADKISLQLKALKENPEIDMVFGWVEQFLSPELTKEEKKEIEFQTGPMIGQHKSTWLIKREAFERVGFFKGSYQLEEFMDWYLKGREIGLTEIMVNQTLAKRRIHTTNISRTKKNLRVEFPKLIKAALDRRRQAND
jgi:glycosyltransferase involved in cell wall biosynthesis